MSFESGQSSEILEIVIAPPVPLLIVHSAIVLVERKPLSDIRGQTSGVGVRLGVEVGVSEGVNVIVGVLVLVGVRLGVVEGVTLGIAVAVREAVDVIDGVTPGARVTVRDGVLVMVGVNAPLVALAAAVLVVIESAVAVCCSCASGVPVVISGEMPASSTIACSVDAIAVCSCSSDRFAPALKDTAVESASTVAFQSIVTLGVTVAVPPPAAAGRFNALAATQNNGIRAIAPSSAATRMVRWRGFSGFALISVASSSF